MKIEEIGIWEAFCAVAKYENFSKASKVLRVGVPQVSKRISKLEDQLGIRLFQRSTRVVKLTDEGKALLPKIRTILEDLSGVESYFEEQGRLAGTIRLTCIPFIAHQLLTPVFSEFLRKHPNVHIELDLSENVLNLIESNIDMAIRIEEPRNSDFIYKKLIPNDLVFCASPKYLRENRAPTSKPEHLAQHKLLTLAVHQNCKFENGVGRLKDFTKQKTIICENGAYLKDLALDDFGILVRSIWDVRDYLKSGELVQVLKQHRLETFGHVYAVIPSRRYLAPRVRALMDLIGESASDWNRECK